MKKNALTILVLCCTLMLDSCIKEIDFNGDKYPPRLVINSLITPGQPVVAELGKTYFFLDQEEEIDTSVPDGLQVNLYVNDQLIGTMEHAFDTVEQYGYQSVLRQYFTSDYLPVEGDILKIVATAPGFEDAEATTSPMPTQPHCNIVGITLLDHFEISQNEEDETTPWFWLKKYAVMTLEITDTEPSKTNYYYLPGTFDFEGYDENFPNLSISIRPTLSDPVFENHSGITDETLFDFYPYKGYTFTDALFEGGSYRIQIPIDLIVNGFNLGEISQLQPKILLPIQQLTKEYYHFLCTTNYIMDQMEILVEPQQTHSNVLGGYGIVGGTNPAILEYPLPIPLTHSEK